MKKYYFLFLILFIAFTPVFANDLADSDWDGVPDKDEAEIYKTDINKPVY